MQKQIADPTTFKIQAAQPTLNDQENSDLLDALSTGTPDMVVYIARPITANIAKMQKEQ